jgi:hypothetical protein
MNGVVMNKDTQARASRRTAVSPWALGVILAEGALALAAAMVLSPLGVALIVANAIAAVCTRGMTRILFGAIAIAATAAYVLAAVLLVPTLATIDVQPPADL